MLQHHIVGFRTFCSATYASLLLTAAILAAPAHAADRPEIIVMKHELLPAHLNVHLGEQVSWRADGGGRLRIELDDHPTAHEVIERAGVIKAVFLKPGQHSYSGTLLDDGLRSFRGVVIVSENPFTGPPAPSPDTGLPPVCTSESSDRICFQP